MGNTNIRKIEMHFIYRVKKAPAAASPPTLAKCSIQLSLQRLFFQMTLITTRIPLFFLYFAFFAD